MCKFKKVDGMNLSIDDVFCTEVCREIAEHLLDPCAFLKLMLNDKFHLLSLSHRSLVQLPLQHFIMSTVEVSFQKALLISSLRFFLVFLSSLVRSSYCFRIVGGARLIN